MTPTMIVPPTPPSYDDQKVGHRVDLRVGIYNPDDLYNGTRYDTGTGKKMVQPWSDMEFQHRMEYLRSTGYEPQYETKIQPLGEIEVWFEDNKGHVYNTDVFTIMDSTLPPYTSVVAARMELVLAMTGEYPKPLPYYPYGANRGQDPNSPVGPEWPEHPWSNIQRGVRIFHLANPGVAVKYRAGHRYVQIESGVPVGYTLIYSQLPPAQQPPAGNPQFPTGPNFGGVQYGYSWQRDTQGTQG